MSDYKPPIDPPPGYEQYQPATTDPYPHGQQQTRSPNVAAGNYQSTSRSAPSNAPGAASSSGGGFMESIKNQIMPRRPLDPPPPSFSRAAPPPSPQYSYAPFPPLVLVSKGTVVADGFNIIPPSPPMGGPSFQGPHPFAYHDINEDDWRRFLEDLKIQGGLTGSDRLKAGVLPTLLQVSTPVGFLIGHAMKKGAKRKKSGVVAQLVDVWNQQFFGPRHMRVFLAKGMRVYNPPTNQPMPPPDWQQLPQSIQAQPLHRVESWSSSSSKSSSSSSSSSSSDSDHGRREDRHSRRDERRARKEERREMRHQRREMRHKRKDERKEERKAFKDSEEHERYRLVVVPA